MGGGADAADCPAVAPGAHVGCGTQRPAGRRRGQAVPRQPQTVRPHGAPLDQRVRRRTQHHLRLQRQGPEAPGHGRRRASGPRGPVHLRLGAREGHRTTLQLV